MVFLVLLNILNLVFKFDFMPLPATPVGIAVINTLFKVFAVCVLFPFSGQLQKLATATAGKRHNDKETELLDRRLLSTPSIAVDRCRKLACEMAKEARSALLLAIKNIEKYNEKEAEQIREMEDKSDTF